MRFARRLAAHNGTYALARDRPVRGRIMRYGWSISQRWIVRAGVSAANSHLAFHPPFSQIPGRLRT